MRARSNAVSLAEGWLGQKIHRGGARVGRAREQQRMRRVHGRAAPRDVHRRNSGSEPAADPPALQQVERHSAHLPL